MDENTGAITHVWAYPSWASDQCSEVYDITAGSAKKMFPATRLRAGLTNEGFRVDGLCISGWFLAPNDGVCKVYRDETVVAEYFRLGIFDAPEMRIFTNCVDEKEAQSLRELGRNFCRRTNMEIYNPHHDY